MKKRAMKPKRVYRKKALRFFKSKAQVSSDVSKSDIQVEPKGAEVSATEKTIASNLGDNGELVLAPPFAQST